MKTKWTLVEQDLSIKWSDEELEQFKENCQMEIDRDIFKRYECDWEFRKSVDEKMIKKLDYHINMSPESIRLLNMSWREADDSNMLSEWREAERESFWWSYINPWREQKEVQMTMILPDTGDFCITELYFDHAPSRGYVSACYTSWGLREREGWMIRQICNDDNRKYSLDDLERMVVQNPHYHDTIKANLIHNINIRRSL